MISELTSRVVYIIGTTAVGKSKLAMDIAKHFNGEIVSADSMQIYQKASLMTAKPTPQDMLEVPHHLVDFVPITQKSFTICDYQDHALRAINEIQRRGKMPVIVGGTMYYVESILYDRPFIKKGEEDKELYDLPCEELYKRLEDADPEHAKKLAPQDIRRIRNALGYIMRTGNLYSQKDKVSRIRFPQSIIIWLKCEPNILEERARLRISNMLNDGGLQEITEILTENINNDYTRGVLQSIGYKEFEPLLTEGEKVLPQCVDDLLRSTIQYSKKQIQWIRNRFEPYLDMTVIDTSNFTSWDEIKDQGIAAVQNSPVLGNREITLTNIHSQTCEVCQVKIFGEDRYEEHIRTKRHRINAARQMPDDEETRTCDLCGKSAKGIKQWEDHLRSKNHKKKARKEQKKEEENREYL